MEIPSNEFRIKNRAVQETRDSGKKPAAAKTDAPPSAPAGSEQIALSSRAVLIQKAHEAVSNSADIRAEKVNAIKEKVQNNEYHVSSDVLAEAVLQEIISESQFTDL
ncbi:MAG: flagellar biosynthesis anti-sigma factor FlgM [Candidatus Nitronauta litoralis]|uniref:Negative regulator of flagellin synthesis n=1 Tax=Candidatus Nitronauta litoralis TaxID=2705533 RepID=A0A7T0BT95_9BACT|nr:MAG: flagellar biosynthesis anti-sigma factor FlgM [Candidatus Nitronauta litoralis]